MNKIRHIQPAQLLLVAATLIGIGILTIVLRDAVREAVVIPLAYAVWMTDLLLRSLPQVLLLAVLLIISALFILRAFSQAGARFGEMTFRPVTGGARSRLGFWVRRLDNLDHSQFAREQVSQELRNLVLKTLAHVHQLDPSEVPSHIRSGAMNVPPEVKALLFDWQGWMQDGQDGTRLPSSLWRRLRGALSPTRHSADRTARLNVKLEAVVEYIEAQTTIQHDRFTR